MRVLVTGASGFVGSTLCDELTRQGHEVAILVRKTSKLGNLVNAKVQAIEGDLRDAASLRAAVQNSEVIFHVAGIVSALNRESFFDSNSLGTRNLAEAAAKYAKNLRRFVYVSSLAAGGPAARGGRREESDSPEPVSFYGESKLAGELALKDFTLPSVIIRPPAVYGPRDRGIFTFFEAIQKGIVPLLGLEKPDPRRYSFVHVDDLVQGILAAAFTKTDLAPNEIFYISGEGEHSWEEAMRVIAKASGRKTVTIPLPIPVLRAAAAACTVASKLSGKVMPLSLDKMKELEVYTWTCSNKKAKEKLGFSPYWDFARGAEQTLRWYREHGWL